MTKGFKDIHILDILIYFTYSDRLKDLIMSEESWLSCGHKLMNKQSF